MELQQRTGSGGHIPVDDGLVSSTPNDAYGALGGGETWSGVPLVHYISLKVLCDDHVFAAVYDTLLFHGVTMKSYGNKYAL